MLPFGISLYDTEWFHVKPNFPRRNLPTKNPPKQMLGRVLIFESRSLAEKGCLAVGAFRSFFFHFFFHHRWPKGREEGGNVGAVCKFKRHF